MKYCGATSPHSASKERPKTHHIRNGSKVIKQPYQSFDPSHFTFIKKSKKKLPPIIIDLTGDKDEFKHRPSASKQIMKPPTRPITSSSLPKQPTHAPTTMNQLLIENSNKLPQIQPTSHPQHSGMPREPLPSFNQLWGLDTSLGGTAQGRQETAWLASQLNTSSFSVQQYKSRSRPVMEPRYREAYDGIMGPDDNAMRNKFFGNERL